MHVHKTAGNKSDNQSREGGKRMKEGKTAAERDRQRIYRNENKAHNTESTGRYC